MRPNRCLAQRLPRLRGRDLLVTREVLEGTRGVLQAALDGLQHDDGSDDRVVSPISRRRRQSRSPKRPQ